MAAFTFYQNLVKNLYSLNSITHQSKDVPPKKGNITATKNYKAITLTCIEAKIYIIHYKEQFDKFLV